MASIPEPEFRGGPPSQAANAQSAIGWWELGEFAAVGLGVLLVCALAIHRLRTTSNSPDWSAAFHGLAAVLPRTLWAAAKIWSFWLLAVLVTAGVLLRLEPQLGLCDAILGGAAILWFLGYALGQLLGPIGLFRAPTIWLLLLAGIVWLWRHPPRPRLRPPTPGQKLALLALGLLAASMLPMQLGSPVVPFMDVLSYPASVQRILTFGVYLPFDNDPYGCWGPYAQTPALELFYALLALGSHCKLAVLAESAAMVPMAGLIIFATYRLGRTFFNDVAGGMAALFLFFIPLFRRAQGMRGTAVDFALVGIGLALFLDNRRNRTRTAIGALVLGTAVASHALDGAFAMMVAGVGVVMWLAQRDLRRCLVGSGCLAGALLVAFPEFAIGLARPLPYPPLPLSQLAGAAIILLSASWLTPRAPRGSRLAVALNWSLVLVFVGAALYRYASTPSSLFETIWVHIPLLMLLAACGLLALFGVWLKQPGAMPVAGLAAFALLLGVLGEYLGPLLRSAGSDYSYQMMVFDVGTKLYDYWCPYFLVLFAGLFFALLYLHFSRPLATLAVLTVLLYPWHLIDHPADYDSEQHSIPELWGFNLATAAQGYWAGHADRRWAFGPAEFDLLKVLDAEIAAGRITPATHILHITDNISSWTLVQFPIFNGVNDDPIEFEHAPNNLWEAGGRVRGIEQLAAALAMRPPYILEQVPPPRWMAQPPEGYEQLFAERNLRLFRRRGLTPVVGRPAQPGIAQ